MFKLTIQTDNEAFAGDNRNLELARILRDTAARVETGGFYLDCDAVFKLRDVNGNTVGEAEITEEG